MCELKNIGGIRGTLADLMKNYLTGREMRTVVKGVKSVWRRVTRGVPQSSVLDPIMCVIYINDQPAGMKSYMSTCMFADDAKIMRRIRNVEDYNKIGN